MYGRTTHWRTERGGAGRRTPRGLRGAARLPLRLLHAVGGALGLLVAAYFLIARVGFLRVSLMASAINSRTSSRVSPATPQPGKSGANAP